MHVDPLDNRASVTGFDGGFDWPMFATEMHQLDNLHAVVTGGGSGMGRAVALRLATLGFRVTVIDRNAVRARETGALLKDFGKPCLCVTCDVASAPAVERAFDRAETHFGPVYLLAAVAGILEGGFATDATASRTLRRLLAVNLEGLFASNQRAALSMIRGARGGRIVNWSSIGAPGGARGYSAYAASKAAVESLTRTLAVEFAAHRITVNAIAPGAVATPMTSGAQRQGLGSLDIPIGRPAESAEVAGLVAYLASSEADYITGAVIAFDGGLTWGRLGGLSEEAAIARMAALQGRPALAPGMA
jgi:NAD(P)-dependent dehydrogenase (short-subunit alcohol dehydrogenase family)